MATVEPYPQRGKNYYRARLELGTDPLTKKRRRKHIIFKASSASRAKAMAVEMEGKEQLELQADPSGRLRSTGPFRDLAAAYLDNIQVSKKTLKQYESLLRLHVVPRLGDIPINEISGSIIARFRNDLSRNSGLAPASVNACLVVLSGALTYAVEHNHIQVNPCKSIKLRVKQDSRLVKAAPVEDYLRLSAWLAENDPDLGAIVDLIAHTGLRRSEALGLRWQDVDFVRGALHVRTSVDEWRNLNAPKTHAERRVWMNDLALAVLERHRERETERYRKRLGDVRGGVQPDWFVFASLKDPTVPRAPDAVTRQVLRSCQYMGLEPAIHPHQLRHLAATLMIGAGIDPKTAAEQLGHSTPSLTLKTYAHAIEANGREAANAVGRGLQPKALQPLYEVVEPHTA